MDTIIHEVELMEIDEEGVLVSGRGNNPIKVYPGGIDTSISHRLGSHVGCEVRHLTFDKSQSKTGYQFLSHFSSVSAMQAETRKKKIPLGGSEVRQGDERKGPQLYLDRP